MTKSKLLIKNVFQIVTQLFKDIACILFHLEQIPRTLTNSSKNKSYTAFKKKAKEVHLL